MIGLKSALPALSAVAAEGLQAIAGLVFFWGFAQLALARAGGKDPFEIERRFRRVIFAWLWIGAAWLVSTLAQFWEIAAYHPSSSLSLDFFGPVQWVYLGVTVAAFVSYWVIGFQLRLDSRLEKIESKIAPIV
jgi:hypothetical protein